MRYLARPRIVAGWTHTGIVAIASTRAVAIAGAVLTGLWAALGLRIGQRHDRKT